MLTRRFAVQLNRLLVERVGLVIETEVVYLKISRSLAWMLKRHFKSHAELQVFRSRK